MKICNTCKIEKQLSFFSKHKNQKDGYFNKCKECIKKEREKIKEHIKLKQLIWKNNNPGYVTKAHKKWRENNLAKHNSNSAKYRASKLSATPKWLTNEHWKEIEQFYKDAEYLTYLTGEKFTVDHIMPLQGKNLCGLHVPWNLQLLTQFENTSKLNRI